jgi:hypothetical protein
VGSEGHRDRAIAQLPDQEGDRGQLGERRCHDTKLSFRSHHMQRALHFFVFCLFC